MFSKYSNIINGSRNEFRAETDRWKNRYLNNNTTSNLSVADILDNKILCDLYPNVVLLIRVYRTIPASVASGERSFSALRRMKSWLRNTTGENRLVALALMHINYDMEIDVENVIQTFANIKNRKREFLL